ncbi:RDD family protein [Allohahella marinimesophila]|uniref:RDD family protein n=1 Tax=Allohahella marinimesophila TaxID=1054972 RepID=A0ABP7PQ04_9GAMM
MPAPTVEATRKAPLPRRFAAMFYDFLLCLALALATTAFYVAVKGWWIGREALDAQVEAGTLSQGPVLTILLLLVVTLFFCYFWTRTGQTLGMQAWKVQILTRDGRLPTLAQSLMRLAGATLSFAVFGAGYFWMLFDREQLTWHERISGTHTVFRDHKKEQSSAWRQVN